MTSRRGVSLLELIATIATLGILASVATLAIRRFTPPRPDDPATVVNDTMRTVLANGRAITLIFEVNGRKASATLNPDGSIIADTVLHMDRFSGRAHAK